MAHFGTGTPFEARERATGVIPEGFAAAKWLPEPQAPYFLPSAGPPLAIKVQNLCSVPG